MKRYLLDTQTVINLFLNSNNVNKNIREDVEYFQNQYFVSVVSLHEFVMLKDAQVKSPKIITNYTLSDFVKVLTEKQIRIIGISENHLSVLEKLPFIDYMDSCKKKVRHFDPFDRLIISQSIAEKLTVITTDLKFPYYEQYGLKVLDARN